MIFLQNTPTHPANSKALLHCGGAGSAVFRLVRVPGMCVSKTSPTCRHCGSPLHPFPSQCGKHPRMSGFHLFLLVANGRVSSFDFTLFGVGCGPCRNHVRGPRRSSSAQMKGARRWGFQGPELAKGVRLGCVASAFLEGVLHTVQESPLIGLCV